MTIFLRRYGVTLLVLGVALLSACTALAADNGTTSFAETAQSFIGGIIASTIINLFVQRRRHRTETKAESAQAKVQTLSRDLGVDDPQKPTPDITHMQNEIKELQTDLSTVKNELVTTLQERDTARQHLARQLEKNSEDNQRAQTVIDRLETEIKDERTISARLEEQLREYDQRFRDQELKMARIEGRLDQQGIQDQLGNTMKTVAKLLNDVSLRLTGQMQPEGTAT